MTINTELLEALEEVMSWIKNWDPNFVEDDEWTETQARVDAAIENAKKQEKENV